MVHAFNVYNSWQSMLTSQVLLLDFNYRYSFYMNLLTYVVTFHRKTNTINRVPKILRGPYLFKVIVFSLYITKSYEEHTWGFILMSQFSRYDEEGFVYISVNYFSFSYLVIFFLFSYTQIFQCKQFHLYSYLVVDLIFI